MMFLQATPPAGFGADDIGQGLGVTQFATEFKKALSDALNPDRFQTFFLKLEDQAKKSARVLGSGVQNYSEILNDTMYNVYKNTLKIGGELGDTSDFLSAIHTSMGTLPSVQQPVIENAIALSKLTSMSVKEIGQYVGEFAKIGLGQQDAINKLNKIYANAKKFGVDASKLTKTVTENLTKANSYGFKGGVEGLTKMAIQAQKLGMSLNNVLKISEDALDPENAMRMASEMQMLGGNVGALADPFRLMYLAQNDVKGLQDEFVKAASSAAIFNEKTGEFEITGEQMRRLRAQADSLGVSYDEIAETAIRARKEQMVMSKVPLNLNVSDETKGIISSLAEVQGGEVKIQIPGTENIVDVANLTQSQIDTIVSMGEEAKKLEDKKKINMTDMAQNQLSAAEGQIIAMNELRNSMITMTGALSKQTTIIKAAKGTSRLTGDGSGGAVETIQSTAGTTYLNDMVNVITNGQTLLQDYITNTGPKGLKQNMTDLINAFKVSDPDQYAQDMFLPDGSAPTIMSEGNVYKGIVGDQVLMGTKLDEAFQVSAEEMKRSRAIAESLGSNLESIGDPFKNMATATVQNKMTSPITKLQETITTTNNNINVSGGATVSGSVDVKVTGNGINLEDPRLSALITAKASALIEERLSKGWNQKQGNVVS